MHILRYIILSFMSILGGTSYAMGPFDKEFKKLIERLDVADEAKTVELNKPTDFWITMVENNEMLLKFSLDINSNAGAEKEAIKKTARLPRFYPKYDESIITSLQGFCDTLLINTGISRLDVNCSLHIVYTDDVNAYTVLTEDGFAMCISLPLMLKKGITYEVLMGYVAHEFSHGILLHHIRSNYADAKERRKQELKAGIAAAFTAAAYVTPDVVNMCNGLPDQKSNLDRYVDNRHFESAINNIENRAKVTTEKNSLKYCREQEYECDLIAFRMLQNLGVGEEYINGLRILGTEFDGLYNEYSDHPTTIERIEFLKFAAANPSLGNKINKKLRKLRLTTETDDLYRNPTYTAANVSNINIFKFIKNKLSIK